MRRLLFFLGCSYTAAVLCFGYWGTAYAAQMSAKDVVQTFLISIQNMPECGEDPEGLERFAGKATGFLNLESMGQAALGVHWLHLNEEQKEEYLILFKRLVEEIAYPQARRFLDGREITFPELTLRRQGRAEVMSVIHEKAGPEMDTKTVFHLHQNRIGWKINDIIIDGVSVVEDRHDQFTRIIQKASFSGLLRRMREKVEGRDCP